MDYNAFNVKEFIYYLHGYIYIYIYIYIYSVHRARQKLYSL